MTDKDETKCVMERGQVDSLSSTCTVCPAMIAGTCEYYEFPEGCPLARQLEEEE